MESEIKKKEEFHADKNMNNRIYMMNRACLGKKKLTRKLADKICNLEGQKGNKLYSYFCNTCLGYHLTRKKQ